MWNRTQKTAGKKSAPVAVHVGAKDKIFAASSIPMWIIDQQTLRFLEVNDAAVKQYGYTRTQFLTMTILNIRPANQWNRLTYAKMKRRLKGPTRHQIWIHQKANGTTFYVDIYSEELAFGGSPAELVWASPLASGSEPR